MKKLLLAILLVTPLLSVAQSPGGVEQSAGVKPAIWLKSDAGVSPTTDATAITGWANSGSIAFTLLPGATAPTYATGDKSVNFGSGATMNFNQVGTELSSILGDGTAGKKYEIFIVASGNANSAPFFYLGGSIPTISADAQPILNHLGFGSRGVYFNSNNTGTADGDGEIAYYGDETKTYVPNIGNQPSDINIANIKSHPITAYGDLNSLVYSVNGFAATKISDGITAGPGGGNTYWGKEQSYAGGPTGALYNLNVQRIFLGGKLNYLGDTQTSGSFGNGRSKPTKFLELIVYNRRLTVEERQKVNSYLAIKYGVYLAKDQGAYASTAVLGTSAGNGETVNNGTYFASDGTVVFKRDATTFTNSQDYKGNAASNYIKDTYYPLASSGTNNGFSFFGRDNSSALANISGNSGIGAYFETFPKSTATLNADKQFMMATHNGGALTYTTDNTTAPFPSSAGVIGRMQRTWKVTATNYGNQFTFNGNSGVAAFLTASGGNVAAVSSDIVLLVSKDPTFPANASAKVAVNTSGSFLDAKPSVSTLFGSMTGKQVIFYLTFAKTNGSPTLLTTLPVELTAFSAKANGSQVNLNWTTTSEKNSSYFEIMRSADGTSFNKIGKVAAAGNSNAVLNYHFTDYAPLKGENYYKLNQYDNDGALNPQEKIASARIAVSGLELAVLGSSSNAIDVNIYSPKATNGTLSVSNAMGQKVGALAVKLAEGYTKVVVPANTGTGLAIVTLNTPDGQVSKKTIK